MRSGSELRVRWRVPWPLGTLPLLQDILCPAMLPVRRGHFHFCLHPWLGCLSDIHMMVPVGSDPQGHRCPWQGCRLDLSSCSEVGGLQVKPVPKGKEQFTCSDVIWHLSVAWPHWLGLLCASHQYPSAPCIAGLEACLVVGQGRPCTT